VAPQAAIRRHCQGDSSGKIALKSPVSGILGEPTVRRCRRRATLPQRGFFETAHLARIYPRLRGFPVGAGLSGQWSVLRDSADIIEL
jgi:hypothetical protein